MLQEVLKEATEQQHQLLETAMFVDQIMDLSLNFLQYKKILLTNYAIHASFEDALFGALNDDLKQELTIENRRKLGALRQDLQEVGLTELPTELVSANKTQFEGDAAILGAMYVLEGATLGGSVIVRKLKLNPNFRQLNLNFNYYQVYGQELVPNWKQFSAVLNTQVPEINYQQTVDAAKKLFSVFTGVQNEVTMMDFSPK